MNLLPPPLNYNVDGRARHITYSPKSSAQHYGSSYGVELLLLQLTNSINH